MIFDFQTIRSVKQEGLQNNVRQDLKTKHKTHDTVKIIENYTLKISTCIIYCF